MPHQFPVGFFDAVDRLDMASRHEKNVHGRLGVDVFERDELVILKDDLARELSLDDLAKRQSFIFFPPGRFSSRPLRPNLRASSA